MHVSSRFQSVFRELGIDGEAVFTHELIKPWRRLPDRENCMLDAILVDGTSIRFHIKRYAATRTTAPAERELEGHRALLAAKIPTAELVAWGVLRDRRSFVIFDDLRGFEAADKLLERGLPFDQLLEPAAGIAASLHDAGLHHRDLYLCHFFARVGEGHVELRLIDPARVRALPALTRRRWIIKDLAEFWYSMSSLPITDEQRERWLSHYATRRGLASSDSLRRSILRKMNSIARHDAALRRRQPNRNISIPT